MTSRWIVATEPNDDKIVLDLNKFCTMTRGNYEWAPNNPAMELTRLMNGQIVVMSGGLMPFNVLVQETPADLLKIKSVG